MEAVELVLKSFYAIGQPPQSALQLKLAAKIPLFFRALMVAERYQAYSSKEKIAEALSSTPANQIKWAMAIHAFGLRKLPGHLYDTPSLATFMCHASNLVATTFGDLPLVIQTARLFQFFGLPFNAVLTLIKRDDLKVHSENDVVYLLNKWIVKNKPSPNQRDALIREIRVINLGPAYIHQILPNLPWLKDSVNGKHHSSAIMAREIKDSVKLKISDRQLPDFPPSWLSAPRNAPSYFPPTSTTFTWILKGDLLKELYNNGPRVSSEPIYHNGHWVEGIASIEKAVDLYGSNKPSLNSGVRLSAPKIQSCHYPADCFIHLVTIMTLAKAAPEIHSADHECKASRTWVVNSTGLLAADFCKSNDHSEAFDAVVKPYLVDGELAIKFEISKVDEVPRAAVHRVQGTG